MTIKEKLKKVYNEALKENYFKTKELKEYGLSSTDLTNLVKKDILVRVKKGEYLVNNIDSLSILVKEEKDLREKIFSYLQDGNYEDALSLIDKCLKEVEKSEYFFLLEYLIKISLSKNDLTFKEVLITLKEIIDNKFNFVIDTYINEFFKYIREYNFEVAKLYLEIIRRSKKLSNAYIIYKDLEQSLEYFQNKDNEKNSKLPNNLLYVLNKDGIFIFENTNPFLLKNIEGLVKTHSDISILKVDNLIVLKKKLGKNYGLNSIDEGNKAFQAGEYAKSLRIFKTMLFNAESSLPFYKIGYSYFKLNDLKLAKKYLLVASILSKKEGKTTNYDTIINSIDKVLNTQNKNEKNWSDEDLLQILKDVNDEKIVLIDIDNSNTYYKITRFIREHEDYVYFSSGSLLVIRKQNTKENRDYFKLRKEATKAFDKKDYELSLKLSLEIAEFCYTSSLPYGKIGECYLKLKNYPEALKYFKAAKCLAQKYGKDDFDYDKIILSTMEAMEKEKFHIELDLTSKIDELLEKGINAFLIVSKLKLTSEEAFYVYLYAANYYYHQNLYDLGDYYIKFVIEHNLEDESLNEIISNTLKYRNNNIKLERVKKKEE